MMRPHLRAARGRSASPPGAFPGMSLASPIWQPLARWAAAGVMVLWAGCSPTAPPGRELPATPAPAVTTAAASPWPSPTPAQKSLEGVREVIRRRGPRFPGRAGIVFYDLQLGRGVYYRERDRFESASLVKLPVLVELYHRFHSGEARPADRLLFEERFRVGGSGVIRKGPSGVRFRLDELARLMIVESDNAATDMLLEHLGMEAIEQRMRELGLEDTTVRRRIFDFAAIEAGRDNLTTPYDVFRLLRGMARGDLPGSEAMLEILRGQRRRDMIPARLPEQVPVAHKTGELRGVLHDAGIVDEDYILVLMGQDFRDREAAIQYWADTSYEIYRELVESSRGSPSLRAEGGNRPAPPPGSLPGR